MKIQKQRRVVHVVHWPKSGINSLLRNMVHHFDKDKFQLHVIFFEYDAETIAEYLPLVNSAHGLDFTNYFLSGIVKYKKLLAKLRPDILHTHSFLPDCLGTLFAPKCLKVCTVHSVYPYFFEQKDLKSAVKRYFSRISWNNHRKRIIAVSKDVKLAAKKMLSESNIQVIENGIDTKLFMEKNNGENKINNIAELITVGRLSVEKGYDVLLHAFKLLIDGFPGLRLTIIGDGPEKKTLLQLVDMLELNQNVNFTGWLNDPTDKLAVDNPLLYICSSSYEGFGLSVAEAMALGLPVVATNVQGVTTLIKDMQTGFLAKPDNPEDLARVISAVIRNNNLRQQVAQNGQKFVCKYFDIRRTVQQYEKVYEELFCHG